MLNGRLPDWRNHLMFMAPPGHGKSLFLRNMAHKHTGILKHGGIPFHNATTITEAGLIGTIKLEADGSSSPVAGDAYIYHNAIFVIEEFMAIMAGTRNGFNAQLEAQLLMVMESGEVNKRLAHGTLDYHTAMSLWVGIQPLKVSLEGGLGRRFCFILNIPSRDDKDRYMEAAISGDNINSDPNWLQRFYRKLELWNASLRMIKSMEFDKSFFDLLKDVIRCSGHEVDIYRRLALGYHLTKYGPSEHMVISVDNTIKQIMVQQADWRTRIKQSPRVQQIIQILQSDGIQTEKGFGLSKSELIVYGTDLELTAQMVHDLVLDAVKLGYVKIRGNYVVLEPSALMESPVMQRARSAGIFDHKEPAILPPIPQTMNYDTLTIKPEYDDYDPYDLYELREYNHDEDDFNFYS